MQIVENQRKRTYPRRFLEKTGDPAEQSKARLLEISVADGHSRDRICGGALGYSNCAQVAGIVASFPEFLIFLAGGVGREDSRCERGKN
jgi:hypothetical protein